MCSAVSFIAAAVRLACTFTHHSLTNNQCRTFLFRLCLFDSCTDFVRIVTVDTQYVPSPCLILHGSIFYSYIFRFCRKLNVVGVVEHDQIIQTQCTGNTSGTLRNLFLDTAIRDISVDSLIHHLVKTCFQKFSGNGSTYGKGMSLSQRTGSVFNAPHDVYFRMSRSGASPLAVFFQFIQCEFTGQCQC